MSNEESIFIVKANLGVKRNLILENWCIFVWQHVKKISKKGETCSWFRWLSHQMSTPKSLLESIGVDGNNKIFTIAYAVVEIENTSTYNRFLELLMEDVEVINHLIDWWQNLHTCIMWGICLKISSFI